VTEVSKSVKQASGHECLVQTKEELRKDNEEQNVAKGEKEDVMEVLRRDENRKKQARYRKKMGKVKQE